MGRLRHLGGCPAAVVLFALIPASPAAALPLTPTPEAPPASLVAAVDASVEANIGSPILTDANDNPTTWVADTAVVLGPGEVLRYRLYAYSVSYPSALDCAAYSIRVDLPIAADGPDAGIGDNAFLGIVDAGDNVLGGSSHTTPAVGESATLDQTVPATGAQLRDGLRIGYGATTVQELSSTGYTFGVPSVELTEDLANCPPPSTTTVAPTTTAAPTTTIEPATTTTIAPTTTAEPATTTSGPPTTSASSVEAGATGETPAALAYTGPSGTVVAAAAGIGLILLGVVVRGLARRRLAAGSI